MRYLIPSGPMPTTVSFATLATGTGLKTLLQFKPKSSLAKIIEVGISFDGSAAATPGKVELIETDVAATVTASVANDIVKWDAEALLGPSDPTTNIIEVGTAATGYNATAEGTITATRLLDPQLIAPTNQYVKQFPLGREPIVQAGKFGRLRVLFGAGVNCYAYLVVEF